MARKNKTLPKDFGEIVERGNLDELKAVFDKCDINAHKRYGSDTALFFEGLTPEFVKWAVKQGADIHHENNFGNTPLSEQVRYRGNADTIEVDKKYGIDTPFRKDNSEIVELLISLGAEIEPKTGKLPIYESCYHLNHESLKVLLAHGADPMGLDREYLSPLETAVNQLGVCVYTIYIAEIMFEYGVKISERMQQDVKHMGREFADGMQQYLDMEEAQKCMDKIYELFDVQPVKPTVKHDGVSKITTTKTDLQEAFSELWDYLVPANGKSETVQGEVIRISGRISHEIGGNGGMNWDDDFKNMLDTYMDILKSENALSEAQLNEAERLKKIVYNGNSRKWNEAEELSNYAVMWVKQNANPIKFTEQVNYDR